MLGLFSGFSHKNNLTKKVIEMAHEEFTWEDYLIVIGSLTVGLIFGAVLALIKFW